METQRMFVCVRAHAHVCVCVRERVRVQNARAVCRARWAGQQDSAASVSCANRVWRSAERRNRK